MTSGEPPFVGTITQIFNGHLRGTPPSLRERARGRVPESLVEIIECALAKHPNERFSSAKAFREELLQAMNEAPASAAATGQVTLPSRTTTSDAGRTLRASEAAIESSNAGGTMLSGRAAVSGATVRRQRRTLKWIALLIALIAIAAVGALVLPGLLSGENAPAKVEEPAAPTTEISTPPAPAAEEPTPPATSPEALDAAHAVAPLPAPADDGALPDGFGPAPSAQASPAAAVPAPTENPVPSASGQSALDLVTQGIDSRPAEEPAATAPEPPATEPAKTQTSKPSEPKAEPKPAKSEPKPEPTPEPPKAAEPAQPSVPVDSGDFQIKVKSKESYKVN